VVGQQPRSRPIRPRSTPDEAVRSDIFCRIRLGDAGSVLMYADNRRVDHLYGWAVLAPS